MRALPTNGKALAMAQPAIASEVHQALDVHRSLAAQVTFYGMVGVNGFADLQHFGVRKILNAAAMINAQLVCDLKGLGASNAMDVGERDNHALVGRDINARNTCHIYNLLLHGVFWLNTPSQSLAPPNRTGRTDRAE